jgi:hypothetical protein
MKGGSMAVTKRYDDIPLQALVEPEMKERINAIAQAERISVGAVVRDILDAGISRRESISKRRAGG